MKEVDVVTKWNNIFEFLDIAKREWEGLQEELNGISPAKLEQEYTVEAQGFLTKFRNIEFDWVLPMFVDFWRGRGGIDAMVIPVEAGEKLKTKKKEKENDGKD